MTGMTDTPTRLRFRRLAGMALALALSSAAHAEGMDGLWRFDIISSAGTTKGAMTVQPLERVRQQADEQERWAKAKAGGVEFKRTPPASDAPRLTGYTGFAMSELGNHALPIESLDVADGRMTMVVNSPRGLVIFRGTINADETRFDGKVTYHNGQVYDMRGVKQVSPL